MQGVTYVHGGDKDKHLGVSNGPEVAPWAIFSGWSSMEIGCSISRVHAVVNLAGVPKSGTVEL
eukprot:1161884-Pelagomonas_calceolata.AAC.3